MRRPVMERLLVRGSQVALKHVFHDMKQGHWWWNCVGAHLKDGPPGLWSHGSQVKDPSLSQGEVRILDNSRGRPAR